MRFTLNSEIERYSYFNTFEIAQSAIGHYIDTFNNNIKLPYPENLYKFYGTSPKNLDSLSENYLYFSSPRDFNDPFDCLSNREEYIINGASDKIKITSHRQNIGVCCFSTINNNPLMWGHYSNSFKGFCVNFENQDLLKNEKIAFKSHISYLKNYIPGHDKLQNYKLQLNQLSLDDATKNRILNLLTMQLEYCWKYYDWRYEEEFRAISINSNDFNRKLPFKREFIKEIYIGFRMKTDCVNYYNSLIDILKKCYPHIKIFEVSPNHSYVKLDFKQIF